MKKLIFLAIFLLLETFVNAQPIEFKTQAYAIALYNNVDSTYEEWGEWELTEIKIILDLDSGHFKIFSQYEQKYRIMDMSFTIEDGHKCLNFQALDNFDQVAILQMVYLQELEAHHLYIVWRRLRLVYQMKKL